MKRINWNLMKPEDIEVRVAAIQNGKATMLLYQNSRTTMDALDEQFGEFGWKIEYKDVGGQIYGRLSIKDTDTGEWICKEDTSSESNIEAQKGLSSGILKRCAVRFGYGRELYSSPRITVNDDGYGNTGYKVSSISYNDKREITDLVIVDRFGNEIWTMNGAKHNTTPKPTVKPTVDNATVLLDFCKANKTDENHDELLKFYDFYKKKISNNEFNGLMLPEKLWNRWLERKKN